MIVLSFILSFVLSSVAFISALLCNNCDVINGKEGGIVFFLPLSKDNVYQTDSRADCFCGTDARKKMLAKRHYTLMWMFIGKTKRMCFSISSSSGQYHVMAAL